MLPALTAGSSLEAQAAALARAPGADRQAREAIARAVEGYLEPTGRQLTTWTPATVRTAEDLADGGNLSYAGQLCEWLLADERVQTCASTRVRTLLGSPLSFEAGRGLRARRALRSLEADEDWWTLLPEAEQARILEWGLLLGVGLAHRDHTARPEIGQRETPTWRAWSPRWLRQDQRTRRWYVRVAAEGGGTVEIEASRENGFALFFPYGSSEPTKRGLWRGLARLALLKTYAIQDFARHSEIHGTPIRAIEGPAPADPAKRSGLAAEVAELGRESVIAMPAGFSLKLIEATAGTWEMFVAQIKIANDSIAIAWLGGNLATDAGDGSQTGATAQTLVRHDLRRFDAAVWSTWTHDEVLVDWAVWNFGTAAVAPWAVYDVDPAADVEAEARALRGLGEAILALDTALAPHGREVDVELVCESYSVPTRAKALELPAMPLEAGQAGPLAAVIPIDRPRRARRVPWQRAS
jgi:hypothetical protein